MKDIYSRKNIIGFIFFIVVFICGIIAGTGDRTQNLIAVTWFGDMPSLLILLSFAGLTYIKKDKYEFHQLGSVLKKDIILGGWMGSIIRFVIYMNISDINSFNLIVGFAISLIPMLYGYLLGNIIESFWPHKFKSVL